MTKKNITLDTLITIEGVQQTVKAFLKAYATAKGYKAFTTGRGEQLSPIKFAELLFNYAVSGQEVDEALSAFMEDIADLAAQIEEGVAGNKSASDVKAEAAAAAKAQKEADELKKQEEEKAHLAIVESFGESIQIGAESTRETTKGFFAGMREAFPESVQISADGTVTIADTATPEEIGRSFGVAVQLSETTAAAGNTLQFVLGELVNASVTAGIFKTKKECSEDISRRLQDAKSGKSLNVKTIENYARVAERIPAEMRNAEASPTVYHAIANVKQPRKAEGESDKAFAKREEKHTEKVKAILEKVKAGEVVTVADAKKEVDALQKGAGIKKDNQLTAGDYGKHILALTLLSKVTPKQGVYVNYVDGKKKSQSIAITKEQIAEALKSATAHYINLRGFDKDKDIDVTAELISFITTASEAPEA